MACSAHDGWAGALLRHPLMIAGYSTLFDGLRTPGRTEETVAEDSTLIYLQVWMVDRFSIDLFFSYSFC